MTTDKCESVKVVVRCRPFSEKEKAAGHSCIVTVNRDIAAVSIQDPKTQENAKTFTFDSAFDWTSKQIDVYNTTARPIVESALEGFNGTVFAYGQTGTGKTFSMEGVRDNPELKGIIPNSIDHIFSHIKASTGVNFLVRASYLEIYNEDIKDLLNLKAGKLDLKEHSDTGVYVKDLTSVVVKDAEEMDKLMAIGNKNRSVGATLMNERSSRSHSIFTITIEASEKNENGEEHIRVGKLNLVDLAGSERQTKTGATGDRLKEASKINLSLSALGNVISALVDGKSSHIPYRDSKLTRLLQDSLGGNARTLMIATLSPASYNFDETMSTLRYANRAKNIKNKPVINEDPKDAMLRELQDQIKALKAQLSEDGTESPKKESKGIFKKKSKPKKHLTEDELAEMQNAIEQEKIAILQSKDMEESEKIKVLKEIEVRSSEISKEREERQILASKLAQLQQQMLVGDENLLDKEEKQREMLAKKAAELEERRRKERELQRKLEESEANKLQLEEKYANLQEEIAEKTKKLKKLWALLSSAKSEIHDLQEENQREREDLLETIRAINREIKLCTLVINQFVPIDYQQKIESASTYDENSERWIIHNVELAGNNLKGRGAILNEKLNPFRPGAKGPKEPMSSSDNSFTPLRIFQNPYLTYDDAKLSEQIENMKISRPDSGSPRKISSGRPPSAGKGRPSSKSQSPERVPPAAEIPVARGLISKQVRYA